jgi:hypothetical protein
MTPSVMTWLRSPYSLPLALNRLSRNFPGCISGWCDLAMPQSVLARADEVIE